MRRSFFIAAAALVSLGGAAATLLTLPAAQAATDAPTVSSARAASSASAATSAARTESRAAPSLQSLLDKFRALPGLSARFHEEKQIALLVDTLASEGTIDFAPPARFARRITSPAPSMVSVNGSSLAFWDGKKTERIDLTTNPVVRLFVDSFMSLLAGDLKALESTWRVTLSATKTGWKLVLVPVAPAIAKIITQMQIEGHDTMVDTMILAESSGDTTTTRFTKVDTQRHYAESELKSIFELPAR